MLLNIVNIKARQGVTEDFNVDLTLSDDLLSYRGYKFLTPVNVKGNMCYKNEELLLNAVVSFKLLALCDNCGEEFEKSIKFDLSEKFVENYNAQNDEEYLINQTNIEIDKPVKDNLLLNIPSRMLCQPKCKGLCPICCKNKNKLTCNCEVD